jgi:hypothetical protein
MVFSPQVCYRTRSFEVCRSMGYHGKRSALRGEVHVKYGAEISHHVPPCPGFPRVCEGGFSPPRLSWNNRWHGCVLAGAPLGLELVKASLKS